MKSPPVSGKGPVVAGAGIRMTSDQMTRSSADNGKDSIRVVQSRSSARSSRSFGPVANRKTENALNCVPGSSRAHGLDQQPLRRFWAASCLLSRC